MTMILPKRLEGSLRPRWLDDPMYEPTHGVYKAIDHDYPWNNNPSDHTSAFDEDGKESYLSPHEANSLAAYETRIYLIGQVVETAISQLANNPDARLMTEHLKMMEVAQIVADMCLDIQPINLEGEQ